MTTAATPAPNDAPKPDATATPAPAANAAAPTPDKAAPAPAAADPKATGTDPAPAATPPPADAGTDVDDGDDSILDLDDDAGEPAPKAEGDKPAEGDGDKAAPASNAWTKEIEETADYYIKKFEKKLSVDKDGKPLTARQKQAAVDDAREKIVAKLARYKNRAEANLAHIALVDKQSSGKLKAALPEDATDEELSAWRKDNGIPDDAAGYKLPKVQGEEWTDADKPGLDKLLGRMHEKNASQAQVDTVLSTYKEVIAEAKAAYGEKLKATDKADTQETQEFLRTEYEGEFKQTMTLLKRLVGDAEVFPDDVGSVLAKARDPETGKRLINNPVFAKFLIEYARDKYGDGAMTTGDQQAQANSEEAELTKLRDTNIDEYMHRPWKTTGMTGSERLLEIMRKKEAGGRGRRAA